MQHKKSFVYQTGLVLGLATFLISNVQASPFKAELLKTGYNNEVQDNADAITPNGYPGATAEDVTPGSTSANTPHADEPPVASDRDPFSEPMNNTTKASDGKCGMSGNGN